MREERQWGIILEMIMSYRLNEPLSRFLKDYYRNHKQMGSGDRRQASSFIYSYFRIRNAFADLETERQLALSNFLCSESSTSLLNYCIQNHTPFSADDISRSRKINWIG
jgi:16S rRNA (cytosine967-C5)-methyltransferase